jgi:hypothetical protein
MALENSPNANEATDICKAKKNSGWEAEKPSSYEPLRAMEKLASFGFAEFLGHCRYLLTEKFIPEQQKSQNTFLGLPETANTEEYLHRVIASSLKRVKSEDLSQMKPE